MPMRLDKYNYEDIGKMLEEIHPSVTIADQNGVFVYVGSSCKEYFGIEADQLLGMSADNPEVIHIFCPCVTAMVLEQRKKVVTVQKSSSGRENLVTGIPIFSGDEEIEMVIAISSWEITSYEELKKKYDHLKLENQELITEITRMSKAEYMETNLIANSQKVKDAMRLMEIFSNAGLSAYIFGPPGTGKRYLTRIAYKSRGLLGEYNCDLLDEHSIEGDLFGTKKERGLLYSAAYRTLVIDNIDRLPPILQKKLVSHLKRTSMVVVGISKYSLEELKEENLITDDFYYLFKCSQVQVYPIYQRPEDLSAFIDYYLHRFNTNYNRSVVFTPKAMRALLSYEWPENLSEIRYTIERIVLTSETERVDEYHLPGKISKQSMELFTDHTSLKDMLETYEKGIILQTYEKYKTTVAVAENLGISQASAVRKIQKYVKGGKENT